jgi:hypothetical protein
MIIADVIDNYLKSVYYKQAYGIICDIPTDEELTGVFMSIYSCDTVDLSGTPFDYLVLADCSSSSTVSNCSGSISFLNVSVSCDAQITML